MLQDWSSAAVVIGALRLFLVIQAWEYLHFIQRLSEKWLDRLHDVQTDTS